MSNISYNSERMKEWSMNINKNNDSYYDNITKLYDEVGGFIGSGYSGGLAEEFLASFDEKKQYFIESKDVVEECAMIISQRADNINDSEQQLLNQIRNEDYFGN